MKSVAEKEAIVGAALNSPEGRKALAKAMVEPIKISLDYQAIGRKLLQVDTLGGTTKLNKRTYRKYITSLRKQYRSVLETYIQANALAESLHRANVADHPYIQDQINMRRALLHDLANNTTEYYNNGWYDASAKHVYPKTNTGYIHGVSIDENGQPYWDATDELVPERYYEDFDPGEYGMKVLLSV